MIEMRAPANANFWERLSEFGEATALIDERSGKVWSYAQLDGAVAAGRRAFDRPDRRLIALCAENDAGAVLIYLSALAAGHPIHIGKGRFAWPELSEFLDQYRPDILLWKGPDKDLPPDYVRQGELFGYHLAIYRKEQAGIGGTEALLLSTSGSLGSPKMVRLSRQNVSVAACQVARTLQIKPSHRAITSLPLSFIYGLSVLHGHLQAGASLVLTQRSVQDPAFWRLLDEAKVTSLAGVPWTYEMLKALSFNPVRYPHLREMTLSGGALPAPALNWLIGLQSQGLNVYSMYGQTEAGGRICVLPPELLPVKPASVGLPVDGGAVQCNAMGEITFSGPNVMLGYAGSREDLTGDDVLKGVLATGDTGHLDEAGCLYITGRTSRIAKLFGLRVDLGEIESFLASRADVAVTCTGQKLDIFLERQKPPQFEERLQDLLLRLRLPQHCVSVRILADMPRGENGKIQYGELGAP